VKFEDMAWQDVSILSREKRTFSLADQICQAVGSIAANIADGRIKLLTAIARSHLVIIPGERGYRLKDEPASYVTPFTDALLNT
jgi:four helix bundle protein